ncbi:MAG: chorismate mutase [Pyrinomonadaceae bacterium]
MKLEDWRNEIDSIDAEIICLLNQRAKLARKIGTLKATAGLPITDSEREEKILRGVCNLNRGNLTDETIVRIFREILRSSKQIQNETIKKIIENGAAI